MSTSAKNIIILILVLAAAVIGYVLFTKEAPQVINNEIAIEEGAMSTAPSDDEEAHGHPHDDATAATAGINAGRKGDVYSLSVKPTLGVRGIGDPNAPVTIREFFSLTCNHCANFHEGTFKELKTKYIDTGKVYFIFEEFPLNGPALYGSMIARCLPNDRYAGFVGLLLKTQEKWAFGGDFKSALKQNAALAGLGEEEFETCYNNKALQEEIANNIQDAAQAWAIRSTPTFVFNDGAVIIDGGQPMASFDAVYNQLTGSKNADSEE